MRLVLVWMVSLVRGMMHGILISDRAPFHGRALGVDHLVLPALHRMLVTVELGAIDRIGG